IRFVEKIFDISNQHQPGCVVRSLRKIHHCGRLLDSGADPSERPWSEWEGDPRADAPSVESRSRGGDSLEADRKIGKVFLPRKTETRILLVHAERLVEDHWAR